MTESKHAPAKKPMTFTQWNAFCVLAFDTIIYKEEKTKANLDRISETQCPLIETLKAVPQTDALMLAVVIDMYHSFEEWLTWESVSGWFGNYDCTGDDLVASYNRLVLQDLIRSRENEKGEVEVIPNLEALEIAGFFKR